MNAQWGAPQGTGVPAGPLTPGSPSEVTFQKLEFLSLQQLRGLLENEEKLAEMVRERDEVQCVELERCTAVASTRSLAELNMGLEPQLALSRAVLSSKYQQLHELLRHYQRKQRQLAESFDGSCCPETLLALLQAETAKAEEEAEAVAESFLAGELPLDDFVESFLARRSLIHLRRAKADKLKEMLLDQ
nr:vacuolar protein sorting-associated protein 37B-like isoform X5 [Petromyzon marinus]